MPVFPVQFGDRQFEARRHLFRHLEIVLSAFTQSPFRKRHDSLIGLDRRIVLDDDQGQTPARAEQLRHVRSVALVHLVQLRPGFGIKFGIAAHTAIRAVLTDQHRHGTITFGLNQQTPLEFQRRAYQRRKRHGFAKDARQILRIVMPLQDARQATLAHTNGTPANGTVHDLEIRDKVGDGVSSVGHGRIPRLGAPMWQRHAPIARGPPVRRGIRPSSYLRRARRSWRTRDGSA